MHHQPHLLVDGLHRAAIIAWSLARHGRAHQRTLAVFVHTVDCEDVLGQIDADVDNGHGLRLPSELMRVHTFPSWHFVAGPRNLADTSGRGSPIR